MKNMRNILIVLTIVILIYGNGYSQNIEVPHTIQQNRNDSIKIAKAINKTIKLLKRKKYIKA